MSGKDATMSAEDASMSASFRVPTHPDASRRIRNWYKFAWNLHAASRRFFS